MKSCALAWRSSHEDCNAITRAENLSAACTVHFLRFSPSIYQTLPKGALTRSSTNHLLVFLEPGNCSQFFTQINESVLPSLFSSREKLVNRVKPAVNFCRVRWTLPRGTSTTSCGTVRTLHFPFLLPLTWRQISLKKCSHLQLHTWIATESKDQVYRQAPSINVKDRPTFVATLAHMAPFTIKHKLFAAQVLFKLWNDNTL